MSEIKQKPIQKFPRFTSIRPFPIKVKVRSGISEAKRQEIFRQLVTYRKVPSEQIFFEKVARFLRQNFSKTTQGTSYSRNIFQNYRNAIAGSIGTGATSWLAVKQGVVASLSGPSTALSGFAASLAGASAGEWGLALGAGTVLGYGLVRTGVGKYLGLEYLGNEIGDAASGAFGPADTNGALFSAVDGVFNFLGLNSGSLL